MKLKLAVLGLAAVAAAAVFANVDDIAKFDPKMAESTAKIDANGIKWIEGRHLPIEGRWTYGDMARYFCRLPDTLTTNVNAGVRSMRIHTSGMQLRFRTDSRVIYIKYKSYSHDYRGTGNIAGVGRSGWDCYRYDEKLGKWDFVVTSHNSSTDPQDKDMRIRKLGWTPNAACLINLPLYDGVEYLAVGIDPKAKIEALGPRKSGINKPVVFYGTSITHGASASRPGLAFVNQVGRDLDVPVYNLGFSGSGIMEYEMSEHIAKIDASCYVLDCLWNMSDKMDAKKGGDVRNPDSLVWSGVPHNYEPFIRNLRKLRPGVPIVMAEQCDVFCAGPNPKDQFIRKLYERLIAEGWKELYYLPKTAMYNGDREGTIDGCHPNDWGMKSLSQAFGQAVAEALKLKR